MKKGIDKTSSNSISGRLHSFPPTNDIEKGINLIPIADNKLYYLKRKMGITK